MKKWTSVLLGLAFLAVLASTCTAQANAYPATPAIWTDHHFYAGMGYLPMWIYGTGWRDGEEIRLVFYMGIHGMGMPISAHTIPGWAIQNGQFSAFVTIPSVPGSYSIGAYQGSVWDGNVDYASCNYVVI